MSKVEHMFLVRQHLLFKTACLYLKLTYFIYDSIILFSEKNYKKQAQMVYQNHLLVLRTVEIFCNLILRNHWTWTWKILDYLIGLGLTL